MEEKKVLSDEELNNASGGLQIEYDNKCPKCHSVAYILVMMEAGGIEHRKCTCCKTEYGVKKY